MGVVGVTWSKGQVNYNLIDLYIFFFFHHPSPISKAPSFLVYKHKPFNHITPPHPHPHPPKETMKAITGIAIATNNESRLIFIDSPVKIGGYTVSPGTVPFAVAPVVAPVAVEESASAVVPNPAIMALPIPCVVCNDAASS